MTKKFSQTIQIKAEVVCNELDAAIEEVIYSQDIWSIAFEDVEAIIKYVDKKLIDGLHRADLANKIHSPIQCKFWILSSKIGTNSNAVNVK